MKRIAIVLLLLSSGLDTRAGDEPYSDRPFMKIIAWLKGMDNYSYELSIHSEMKAHPKDKQEQHSTIYSSNADFIRYVNGASESSFMSKSGMFKVNHKSREVGYKQFNSEQISARVIAAASVADPGRLLDSVLFDKANIRSKKKTGDVLEYTLSYKQGYMIKSLELRYDTRRKLLLSVSYILERYMNGIRQEDAIMRQTVTMSNYKQGRPIELETILRQSDDLNTYLHTSYAGYNIHNL